MNYIQNASVFRVCAVDEERWDVTRDPSNEPVASFKDKHSALAYAMNLARERTDWRLPPGRQSAFGIAGDCSRAPRGAQS